MGYKFSFKIMVRMTGSVLHVVNTSPIRIKTVLKDTNHKSFSNLLKTYKKSLERSVLTKQLISPSVNLRNMLLNILELKLVYQRKMV